MYNAFEMIPGDLSYALVGKQVVRPFLRAAIQVSQILETREPDYETLISRIERDPWFRKLSRPQEGESVIRRIPWPRTRISSFYFQEPSSVSSEGGMSEFFEGRREMLSWIRSLGRERFERYFLYPVRRVDNAVVARACRWPVERVSAVQNFVDSFLLYGENKNLGRPLSGSFPKGYPVARVERDVLRLYLCWLTPYYARGRYSVDWEALKQLKRLGGFSARERREIQDLVLLLKRVNSKQSALVQTLELLMRHQRAYFMTGSSEQLRPLAQNWAADRLGFAPSTVSRLIQRRSILTPWGEDVELSRLFPSRKNYIQSLLKRMMRKSPRDSDAVMQKTLKRRFHLEVSRKLVNLYRREIHNEN